MEANAENKGYLHENFRLFHLRDSLTQIAETHYHEFDKFVLVCAGTVEYTVEGVCNRMQAGDMLFVRHRDLHRSVMVGNYERYVLWITPEYLERCSDGDAALHTCFERCAQRRSYLLRPPAEQLRRVRYGLTALEQALEQPDFGQALLADACFRTLLVELNRCVLAGGSLPPRDVDPKIDAVLRHINANLTEPLSVDALAARCYLSRYYFMRLFRAATGYSVHSYIQQKRLSAAAERLDAGQNATEAAMESGFSDYSAFLRAFRKSFGQSPREYQRRQRRMDSSYRE